jgi:glycosyltransferase involved in cell wall biosynthesis
MRILFYFRTHFDDPSNIGVINKCRAIVSGFNAAGAASDTLFFSQRGLEKSGEELPVRSWPHRKRSLSHIALYYFLADRWLVQNIDFQAYSHFYIRHFPTHPAFLNLLKTAKKQHPQLKILVEFPTWPYDKESRGWMDKMIALPDRFYRKSLYRYTDHVLHYGIEPSIMGIPAIPVSNGIDWQHIPVRATTPAPENTLRIIAAGNWNTWHGLDRIMEGIKLYQRNKGGTTIHLNIVGNGPAIPALKKRTVELQLEQVVQFHPPSTGDVLSQLFDHADIAVGVLGLHRKGLSIASPLKHREYCARGIPFIMAGKDSDFAADWPYALNLPEDDSPVDMATVLAFVQQFKKEDVGKMRQFAERHLGWEVKIKAISNRYFKPVHPSI